MFTTRVASQLRSPILRQLRAVPARRAAHGAAGESGLSGAADNAFNRERAAVKAHAAATSGEFPLLSCRQWPVGQVGLYDVLVGGRGEEVEMGGREKGPRGAESVMPVPALALDTSIEPEGGYKGKRADGESNKTRTSGGK